MLDNIERAAGGLRPDEIGYALGLTAQEWSSIANTDIVQAAMASGRAKAKLAAAEAVFAAIEGGDAKVAMDYLTHQGGWRKQSEADAVEVQKAQVIMDYSKLSIEELQQLERLLASAA